MKWLVEDDTGHDPGQPDGDGDGQEDADVLGLAVVVPKPATLHRQARREHDQKDDVQKSWKK